MNQHPFTPGDESVNSVRCQRGIQTGARKNKNAAIMKPIVDKLSDREIVAVSAYLASKSP